jgi:plastocyanin
VRSSRLVAWGSAAAIAAIAACGGSNSSNPGTPSTGSGSNTCTAPSTSTTITISNNTVCPQNITVPPGTQVTFVNNDTVAHEMNSDPHPEHTDCPEINAVGHLEPGGQARRTENLTRVKRCGFHDHLREQVQGLKGSITIR